METYKFKVCLVGGPGVGETSLIRRYAYGAFSDKYLKLSVIMYIKRKLRARIKR